jgi:hypothetical protein
MPEGVYRDRDGGKVGIVLRPKRDRVPSQSTRFFTLDFPSFSLFNSEKPAVH